MLNFAKRISRGEGEAITSGFRDKGSGFRWISHPHSQKLAPNGSSRPQAPFRATAARVRASREPLGPAETPAQQAQAGESSSLNTAQAAHLNLNP